LANDASLVIESLPAASSNTVQAFRAPPEEVLPKRLPLASMIPPTKRFSHPARRQSRLGAVEGHGHAFG